TLSSSCLRLTRESMEISREGSPGQAGDDKWEIEGRSTRDANSDHVLCRYYGPPCQGATLHRCRIVHSLAGIAADPHSSTAQNNRTGAREDAGSDESRELVCVGPSRGASPTLPQT